MKKKIAAAAVLGALASSIAVAQPAFAGDSWIMKHQWNYPASQGWECYSDGQWYVETHGFKAYECRDKGLWVELWAVPV
ncbi:hypothetical protein SAMN05421504_107315 [Amycolatopsis xylanica]|uniref:Uncharacterized protein n=1 Tax=Amycolatopsis xylanica TaxID=589385 RepID=A0A1H3NIM1_9PSEU|nr:hypothetical protein [Amycolatopsis xylanica]SDY88603.1 hypothetical protein SAMN05421504_107315 [Amycolatopsis xylanica]